MLTKAKNPHPEPPRNGAQHTPLTHTLPQGILIRVLAQEPLVYLKPPIGQAVFKAALEIRTQIILQTAYLGNCIIIPIFQMGKGR